MRKVTVARVTVILLVPSMAIFYDNACAMAITQEMVMIIMMMLETDEMTGLCIDVVCPLQWAWTLRSPHLR